MSTFRLLAAQAARPVAASPALSRIPELRKLFDAGRHYLQGKASLHQLHGRVCHFRVLAKAAGAAPAVLALLDEWAGRIERRWNEFVIDARPHAESEFTAWLRNQLVFDRGPQSRSGCA